MSDEVSNDTPENASIRSEVSQQVLAEYTALRNEIIKRIEMRQQLLTFTLVGAGTLMTLGATEGRAAEVLLIYPILAFFLALGWTHNDVRIGELGGYLKEHVEQKLQTMKTGKSVTAPKGIWWEHYVTELKKRQATQAKRKKVWSAIISLPRRIVLKATEVAASGVFFCTQILALIIVFQKWPFSIPQTILLFFDAAAIILTIRLLRLRRRGYGISKEGPTSGLVNQVGVPEESTRD